MAARKANAAKRNTMSMAPSIVLFGFGTVGQSVAMLKGQYEFKAIAVRRPTVYRETFPETPSVDVATAIARVPDADVVVEGMGGTRRWTP